MMRTGFILGRTALVDVQGFSLIFPLSRAFDVGLMLDCTGTNLPLIPSSPFDCLAIDEFHALIPKTLQHLLPVLDIIEPVHQGHESDITGDP